MDTQQIHAAAQAAGIAPQALDLVTGKVRAHFGDTSPRPADLDAFLLRLDVWVKLGMTQQEFYAMPASWRLGQGFLHQAPQPDAHPRRPMTHDLTAEELKTIEGLAWAERMTQGRQMQQRPPAQQGGGDGHPGT